jgi:peptide/nickel transport system permease protein
MTTSKPISLKSTRSEQYSGGELAAPSRGIFSSMMFQLSRNPIALTGFTLLLLISMAALFAPQISPYDPYELDFSATLLPPNTDGHLLGTDDLGRDTLTRLIYGGRISLVVGLIVVGISGTIGVTMGMISGYFGGTIDMVIMRFVDLLYAFPFIILAIAVVGIMGASLINVMLVLACIAWINYARMVRGLVLQIKQEEYVTACRALGAGHLHIIVRHILPNCLNIIAVQATFGVAGAILAAAALSFLGLGAQPPTPEWGAMLSDGQRFIRVMPILSIAPGVAIMLVVVSINLIGDSLRDAMDPHTR